MEGHKPTAVDPEHLSINGFNMEFDRRNSEPFVDQTHIIQSKNYGHEVLVKLNGLRNEHCFTDAILCVGDREFPCHRNVLAVSSPYFRAMFTSDLRESKEVKIPFNEVSPSIMLQLIDYAYTGRAEINVENAQELLAAGSLFQYPAIMEACCEFLAKHLHPSNCLGIENFAHMHSCTKLELEAHQFALENFSAVVEYDEFLELSPARLISYLSSDLIDVRNEETVYDAAMLWIQSDVEERIRHLTMVLENVRLATVDVAYLESVIEKDPLIQKIEECKCLVDDAKRYHETLTDQHGQRRRSMQTDAIQPRPSTVAKEVMVLVGGVSNLYNTHVVLPSVEMYDPHKDKWLPLPEIPCAVSWFSVTAFSNNIFVSGGIVDNKLVSTAWKFESAQRVWSEVAPMLIPRARHASAVWNNKIYVLGGINVVKEGKFVAVETIECYDMVTNTWSNVGHSPLPRNQSHVVPYNDTLVEIGGTQGGVKLQTMESYLCSPDCVNYSGEQFVLPDSIQYSQIVVLNGIFYILWEDSKKLISLNPLKRIFRRLADMRYPHVHGGATVLNGKIYVTGGLMDSKPSRITECFDPATNTWTLVKPMRHARACQGCVTIQMR